MNTQLTSIQMWGGAGHNNAHVVASYEGFKYCIQVESPLNTDDAAWGAYASKWANFHDATIEDGLCANTFQNGNEVYQKN